MFDMSLSDSAQAARYWRRGIVFIAHMLCIRAGSVSRREREWRRRRQYFYPTPDMMALVLAGLNKQNNKTQ